MFKSRCLLDISSGWGDKLIGAIMDVDIFRCDPNSDYIQDKNMVDFFENHIAIRVLESPFEIRYTK